MARDRQRRKERQQERQEAPEKRETGGVAEELREEADVPAMPGDAEAEQVTVTGPGDQEERTFAEAEAETFEGYEDVGPGELIAALGPLRRTRRHSLLPGIRMFTAMLEETRGGYAADRLAQLQEALDLDFNQLETEGILQVAMAEMDETGVPDVEHGVRLCLEARAQLEVAEIEGDGEDEQDRIDEVREAEAAERADADAAAEQEEDFAAEEEHDAPGRDEA